MDLGRQAAWRGVVIDCGGYDHHIESGRLYAVATGQGVVSVGFESDARSGVFDRWGEVAQWSTIRCGSDGEYLSGAGDLPGQHLARLTRQLDEYFSGHRRDFSVPVDLGGVTGPFRRAAVQALARIPYGETATYAQLAELAGNARAFRAAASACASNPLPILYPCHRVVRSDGQLGEYRGGKQVKEALLRIERNHPAG